jgi:hypothetical protein
MPRGWTALAAAFALSAAGIAACAASSDNTHDGNSNGNGNGAGAGNGVGAGDSSGAFMSGTGGGNTGSSGVGGACASSHFEGKLSPLDIYIMLDKSGSMDDDNKWVNTTNALQTFVQSPEVAGIGVGLQLFPINGPPPPACNQCTDCNCIFACGCNSCTCINNVCTCSGTVDSCAVSDYATAAVEIAPLPGNASAIIDVLNQTNPQGGTPTRPSLEGAISHARDWALSNPDHKVVVVFATDGEPSTSLCAPNTIPDAQQVAQDGLNGTPSIPTYVIGVGLSLTSLNAIAAAGGTGTAYIIDSGGNTTQQFIDAMNDIRESAGLDCEYQIPEPLPGEMIDFTKVNVQYIPGDGGPPEDILHAKTAADCDPLHGGWYYDDNNNPTKILMCPATCAKIENDNQGKIDILLGCDTKEIPE